MEQVACAVTSQSPDGLERRSPGTIGSWVRAAAPGRSAPPRFVRSDRCGYLRVLGALVGYVTAPWKTPIRQKAEKTVEGSGRRIPISPEAACDAQTAYLIVPFTPMKTPAAKNRRKLMVPFVLVDL